VTRVFAEGPCEVGGTVVLRREEHRYLASVRRHRPGDEVEVRDDAGGRFRAVIARLGRGESAVEIIERLDPAPAGAPVRVLSAVPKRNLMDGVVRRLSELGVMSLVPVITGRSVVDPGEGKLERWRRIAEESVRQCGRRSPLEIADPVDLETAVVGEREAGIRLVLHPEEGALPIREVAKAGMAEPVVVAIGPEGGFTGAELSLFEANGFTRVSMGGVIMRVETAIVAVCAVAVAFCGEILLQP